MLLTIISLYRFYEEMFLCMIWLVYEVIKQRAYQNAYLVELDLAK